MIYDIYSIYQNVANREPIFMIFVLILGYFPQCKRTTALKTKQFSMPFFIQLKRNYHKVYLPFTEAATKAVKITILNAII